MSFKPEVQTDNTGNWYSNRLAFETREEAEFSAKDLAARWILVRAWRVVESDERPNYRIHDGLLEPLPRPNYTEVAP